MGLKTVIATTTPKFWFQNDIASIVDAIDFICTGYEAGYEKSNPRIYQKIMETFNVEPWEVVVICDNIELDVRNPKNLGMKAIHIKKDQDYKKR